ncbi:uncharacterized protein [Triticum aestivum]|uniref:uncharacterized protein n=1 Tax=Triticum aestivum TaxID=4565 RepID=UPI001D01CFFF|nr:uncharacterized protein LOC123131127 [Triticum aestivum]
MVLAGGTVAAAAAEGDALLESVMPKTVLHCNECHHPLKPSLYLCSRMRHVACGGCVGGGDDDDDYSSGDDSGDDDDGNEGGGVSGLAGDDNEDGGVSGPAGDYKCSSCTDLAASVVYVKSPYLDTLFSNAKVSCPYKKYGCGGTLAFRDAAAHAAACGFAPCLCPECSFEGLPADLVRHLTEKSSRHGWPAHKITYGENHPYVFDELNKEPCQKLLVAEEDDGMFLLDIVRNKDFFFVNLLCVRNKAVAVPVYSSSVAVEGPPAKGLMLKLERKVVASCQAPADLGYYNYEALPVHPGFLHGEQTKKLHVCVCIRKTQSTSA